MIRRYDAFSRRELRARFRAWIGRNRTLLALAVGGATTLLVFETVLILWLVPDSSWKWYVLGVLHAAIMASFSYLLHSAFLAHDREAILHLRGAWGEENTRSELQTARRKRLIWGWVDSVTLQNGDIDHLVVTRSGGLVAIDSKWRNHTDAADREAMARAALKVRLRAEGLMRTLLTRERGAHRANATTAHVTPLLVLWGAAQHSVPEGAQVDGIDVVGGRRLVVWLKARVGEAIDEDAARDIITRLEGFRAGAWEQSKRPRDRA